MQKKLVVICKERDEVGSNLLRKLIENNKQPIDLVTQTSKVWQDNKATGNYGRLATNVLFINNVKGVKELEAINKNVYDEYGIRIGYAGSRAYIVVNPEELADSRDYSVFLSDFTKLEESDNKLLLDEDMVDRTERIAKHKLFTKVVKGKTKIRKQQLVYGVSVFYKQFLSDFLELENEDD